MEKDRPDGEAGDAPQTAFKLIQFMTVAEKVKFAMHAGKEARSILIRDPNKQVAMSVMSSPKITEEEILLIAQSRNASDDILRVIAANREWMKNYAICYALTSNPKTPLAISQSFLSSLRNKDLAVIGKGRNVSEALKVLAQKVLRNRLKDE
jgi:hypothetical protein